MPKIKVLHILETLDCGGIETLLMNVYRNCDRNVFSFDFITMQRHTPFFYEKEALSLGANIYRYISLPGKLLAHTFNILSVIKKHGPYNAVHAHYTSFNGLALFLAFLCGVKIRVSHAHIICKKDKGFKAFYNFIFRRMIALFATHRLACSDVAGRALYGRKSFIIVKNGIDLARFAYNQEARKTARASLGMEDRLLVAHSGRMEQEKNHNFILQVFAKTLNAKPDSRLILMGDGSLRGKIEQQAKDLNIYDKVLFMGVTPHVADFLQAADVFIFPSTYEALGISLIEAQAAGLPCIVSDKIPAEARVTNCTVLPIEAGAERWSGELLIDACRERKDTSKQLAEAGFDIKTTVNLLQGIYKG